MIARALALALCTMLGVSAGGAFAGEPSAPSPVTAEEAGTAPHAELQMLLMMRAPPAHFRPEASYAGSYQATPDREARRRIARALAGEHGLRLVDDWPMPSLGLDCFVLEASTPEDVQRLMPELSRDPRVESVQPMQLFHLLQNDDPLAPAQPAVSSWHLRELHAQATGKGVAVAELDTGVDRDHPDLTGQVALSRNFVDESTPPAETHGTQVAGIIAARANDGVGIAGVAPGARLLALRACWQEPSGASACSSFTLAKALQFALLSRAQVFNLSLSGPDDRLLARLLDAAMAEGAVVVGASDAKGVGGGFPADHPGVLAVAGSIQPGAAQGTLLAPARGIPAPVPGGGWGLASGSSYAAAQVSGLVALLRELSPGLSAARIRAALTPGELGLLARRPASIDACAAVARVAQRCACDCAAARTVDSVPRR